MSVTEARIVVVRSITTSRLMDGGIDDFSRGSTPYTWSTVLMMFAPGCRKTMISTAGLPLANPTLRVSSTESSTSATSPRRAAADKCLATATDLSKRLREDGIGNIVNARKRDFVGTERQDQNRRVGRVDLAVAGIIRKIRRQLPAGGIDGGLHIARRRINVPV